METTNPSKISGDIIEHLPIAIYTCNKDGYVTGYNNAAAILWGRHPEIGKDHWCGLWKIFKITGTPLPLDECPMAIALKEKRPVYGAELIIERPDGSHRYVRPYPTPLFDSNGDVTGAVNMVEDITDKEMTERYTRSLIEANIDPLVAIAVSGEIIDMNEAMLVITGKMREQLKGTDFSNYFTDSQKERRIYQEVFAKGFVKDYPLTMKDGKLTPVLFNGSVYKDGKGNVLGAVVVARDISNQKKVEKELTDAKMFAEMARKVAEEAKNNAESATIIAEDATRAAIDAVNSKQQFLSNMSHEIRTPMNAIIGFTTVLLKTKPTVKQKEYLSAIKVSGDTLIVLINDILDLAKVDAGKMTFEQKPFKMALSISAMLHLFETKIQERNLELVKEYDDKIPEALLGDPTRLHQIILNLVSNAIKFTAKGKITVGVLLLKEDDENATLEFSVTDTGIGIPQDKIKSIFEIFQQASFGTSRLYGGTGLGLTIVKQLVESQGGSIHVTSKVNEGSTFSFILSFHKTKS